MRKLPFNHNPRLAARQARLYRLIAKGIIAAPTKQAQRDAAQKATAGHVVHVIGNTLWLTPAGNDDKMSSTRH